MIYLKSMIIKEEAHLNNLKKKKKEVRFADFTEFELLCLVKTIKTSFEH